MHSIIMPRGDSRVLRITPKSGGEILRLSSGDTGIFRVYDTAGASVLEKSIDNTAQAIDGALEITIAPEDTAAYGITFPWLRAGEVVALFWELELRISGHVITPAIAEPFQLVIDAITPSTEGGGV